MKIICNTQPHHIHYNTKPRYLSSKYRPVLGARDGIKGKPVRTTNLIPAESNEQLFQNPPMIRETTMSNGSVNVRKRFRPGVKGVFSKYDCFTIDLSR